MERRVRRTAPHSHCSASDTGQTGSNPKAAALIDNRPAAVEQRNLIQAIERSTQFVAQRSSAVGIHNSPACMSQRKQIAGSIPGSLRLKGRTGQVAPSPSPSSAIQLKWLARGGTERLEWDTVIGGLKWFYDTETERFSYWIENDLEVPYERWPDIERLEGVPLTEEETDKLGFAEIDFEEGDDAIEYVAPSPEFAPLGEDEVTPKGEQELVEMLTKHLVMQTQCTNYDRLAYINAFADYRRLHPKLSEEEALARFEVDSAALVQQILGGHCGGLSGDLLRSGDYGKGAYLVGSKLPNEFQQAKAPEYCHVAAMIRFQHPETAEDNGLIILEPGFNITKPIVVKKGVPGQVVVGDELWVFTLNKDCTEVVCQPQPLKDGEKWKKKKSDDKRMTYRTDRFLNPDLSLTVPFLHVDNRPQVLARDEKGDVVAVIAINYGKRRVEFRIGKDRFDPVPFENVTEDGTWLGQAAKPLAKLLKMTESTLIKRIFDAVNK